MAWKELPGQLLLAEDDDDDYLIFSLALKETKLATSVARVTDGDELMAKLEKSIPDILFLDIRMPCRDGKECLKEIRADSRFNNMPIIIKSAFWDENNIAECYRAGATRYVIKPNTIRELTGILQKLLIDDWKMGLSHTIETSFVVNPRRPDRG